MVNSSSLVRVRRASLFVMVACLLAFTSVTLAEATGDLAINETAKAEIQEKLAEFDQYAEAGQGAAAISAFQTIKIKYPQDPQVRAYEAKILALQNKMLEAVPLLESLLKDHPNHPLGSALLANIEYRMGKKAEATKRTDDALAVHPDSWELLQISGEIMMAEQKMILTLPVWRKIVDNKSNPDVARMTGYAKLGIVYNSLGRYEEAADSLEQALAIKWHPSVGMALIQALDQAKLYERSFGAIADMRKQLAAAGNNPQYAQLRQQFETQIVPFETRAKQSNVGSDIKVLDQDIASGKADYPAARGRISALTRTIDKTTDAQTKAAQKKLLVQTELLAEMKLLETGIKNKYGLDWQKGVVKRIEEISKDIEGSRVDEANALVQQVMDNINKQTLSQRESVLDLAGKGWTLKEFLSPNTQQLNELKERGLPERYDHFTSDLRKTLKDFYTPLVEKREKLELESATAAFVQNPTDKALQAKVAKLLTERVASMDISKEGASNFDVIPARVWTEPPSHKRSIDMDEKTYDRRERAYSIGSRLGTYKLMLHDRSETLIAGYSRALAEYPRRETLRARSQVYMYLGQYRQAWEDLAASVAVAAWEEANAPRGASLLRGTWGVDEIPSVVALEQLATGKIRKDGLYPAADASALFKAMQTKNWAAAADLIMQPHDAKSLALNMMIHIRDGRHRDEILDALVARYRKATSEEDKKAIMARIDYLQSYHNHTAAFLLKAESEKDPEQRLRRLIGAVNASPRDVKAAYELAKQYEALKKLEDAMLVYNIAAGGKLLTQTTGLAKEAATARDRLSGPLANISEAVKVYEPHMNNINDLVIKGQANAMLASQYEALLLLFLNYNGNRKAIIGRLADGRRAMQDYTQANEDLVEYAKFLPDKKGIALAMTARNEMDSGLYPQALKTYQAATDAGYTESWVYYQMGLLQSYLGNYKEALDMYTQAIEKKPEDNSAYSQRSELYEYFFDDNDKAIADAEKALEILTKKNPEGDYFSLKLRLNNMKMVQAQKALGI